MKPKPKGRWPAAVWLVKRKAKRGGHTYRLRWRDRSGRWHSQACGRDFQLARELRDRKRDELRRGATGEIPDVTIGEFAKRIESLMAGKSENTTEKTRRSIELLDKLCGPALLADVDRAMVMDFRNRRLAARVSPATVNKHSRELKSALSYGVDAGLLEHNPLIRWKQLFLPEPQKKIRVVEPAEFQALLAAVRLPEFRALLITAYRQGLRRTELCNLRWLGPHGEPIVDFSNGLLHVINRPDLAELTKSRRNRCIPLHPGAREALLSLWERTPKIVAEGRQQSKHPHVFTTLEGWRLTLDWITHEFTRTVKRAGIAPATLHDLRRSFSTLAQRAGVDKHVVKDLGGWSSVSVVERHYSGDVSVTLKRAMDRIVAAG